jgi:hypothetical protein
MLQAINSKRKSEGNDCTENISDQTFKRLIAIYFIPYDRKYAYCKARNQWGLFHRASGIINTRLVKMMLKIINGNSKI